jgi:hypothetical protein
MTSTPHKALGPSTAAQTQKDMHEARAGDRGAASGRNIAQNRAIGQDDPLEGSRMGREQHKSTGYPGSDEAGDGLGTDAAQVEEAEEAKAPRKQKPGPR